MPKPTVIDLFAGCGGMTQGFVDAGYEPVFAVEWDRAATATYRANFGEHAVCGDIADVPDVDVPDVDVVIGGPPCQGFSNLGTRDPDDPRNKLWMEFMRVVIRANPQVFVVENVDRFSKSTEFGLLVDELNHGKLADYEFDWQVLNAADYGVPQRRRRTILVASRVGRPSLPLPTHQREPVEGGVKPWKTVLDAFEGLPWAVTTTELPKRLESSGEPGPFSEIEIHFGRNPRPLSLARYDAVPPGGGRFNLPDELLPKCWRDKPSGTTDVMGRMRWEAPSLTIRTEFFKPEKGAYLHPQWAENGARVNRVITHAEAARLQTFPRDFKWCGSKTNIAKQIGNAVPPRLAEVIGAHIKKTLLS